MKKVIALVMVLAALVGLMATASADSTMYVYTKNGGTLNVRSEMSLKGRSNILGKLEYGAKVTVISSKNGWSKIRYGKTAAFVRSEFLQASRPAANPKNVKKLSLLVSVRPSRDDGYVNFRVGPDKKTERLNTFGKGYELKVIGETGKWYKAVDPATGMTGYISKNFVTVIAAL